MRRKIILHVPELAGNHSKVSIILALAAFDEVDSIDINLRSREVLVDLERDIDPGCLIQALVDEGYFATLRADIIL